MKSDICSKKVRFLFFPLLAMSFIWITASCAGADTTVNKRYVYYIFWSGIRAGKAVMNFRNTSEGVSISTHATSATLISLFYKVDDYAQSILYPDGHPKKFSLKVRQGRHKRDKVTYFDPVKHGAAQKVVFHNVRDEETEEFLFEQPVYDPLSAFYEMTRWDLRIGESAHINIFDNKKLWNTEIKVLRREKVRVPAGEFDTIVVQPMLRSEGIFPKTGDIYIWATNDEKKLPVKLKSKAVIGHFTVLLVEGDY